MFAPETKILVVDDMAAMRQIVKNMLREMKFKNIVEAENGEAAFNTLVENQISGEPIQLVLSDWNMPVCTGIDFLKKVRSAPDFKSLPFMLITAEGEKSQVLEAIKLGVSDYLVKPLRPVDLTTKLENVFKKHNK